MIGPTTLSLLIWAQRQELQDLDLPTYIVLGEVMDYLPDERKADLYARIVEGCPPDLTLTKLEEVCRDALEANTILWGP